MITQMRVVCRKCKKKRYFTSFSKLDPWYITLKAGWHHTRKGWTCQNCNYFERKELGL